MSTLPSKLLTLLALIMIMVGTRFPGLGSSLHLHDASWAVFFVAGFYLAGTGPWAFAGLLACAVATDFIAIQYYGTSNYCVTPAYWFLIPAYGALWLGGRWLRRHESFDGTGLLALAASALVATSACFLVSNGSFYWVGGRVTPTWAGWMANFTQWYWPFVRVALAYIAVAALGHVLVSRLLVNRPSTAS